MSLRQDPNPANPTPFLPTRAFKLRRRPPRMAHTLLREKYRQKFGIAPDRRSGRLSLRPTLSRRRPRRQPEFFLNEIFRPALLKLDYRSKTPVLAHLACTVSAPAGINATGT